MKTIRKSNIELIRVISMFMIVGAHYTGHGIFRVSTDEAYLVYEQGEIFNKIIALFFTPGGKVGVALFFMIVGFFGYKREKVGDLSRVISITFFYAVLVCLIGIIIKGLNIYDLSMGVIFSAIQGMIIPISSGVWWFLTSYVLLMLLSPMLNKIIEDINYRGSVFVILYFGIALGMVGLNTPYYDLIRAPLYYILGAYIGSKKIRIKKRYFAVWASIFSIGWIGYMILTSFFIKYVFEDSQLIKLLQFGVDTIRIGVFVPLAATSLFLIFVSFDFYNSLINAVASTTFGIYLLHDSNVGRILIWDFLINPLKRFYFLDARLFMLFSLISIVSVFVCCMSIDFIRKKVFEKKVNVLINGIKCKLQTILYN